MRFEFFTPTRILLGDGVFGEVGAIGKSMGRRALVVTGQSSERATKLLAQLESAGLSGERFAVTGEPTTNVVSAGVAAARAAGADFVIGFGGGSALDAAKAIAALITNKGELLDYLEVVGKGMPLTEAPAPFMAIPTTAGTGTEVTRNAVLASPEHKVKVSIRSPLMMARVALIDPQLSLKLPPAITASTGLDALTQLIEPYVCLRANPMVDALCREGMTRAGRSLRIAYRDGSNLEARTDMCVASLFGGLALANAGLGAVHGFAGPIGGAFDAPHGAVCAALLPHVMESNIRALRERSPKGLGRYDEVARILTGDASATAQQGVEWVRALVRDLNVPCLGTYGIAREHIPMLVQKSAQASSMKPNPIVLTPAELTEILEKAI